MSTHPGGRAEPQGLSLADQDEAQLGGRLSVLVRQKRDHVRLERLLHELEEDSDDQQARTLIKIYRLVFPHAFAEESVLWPVVRRALPDGEALTQQVEVEHQEVNELVSDLDDPELDPDRRRLLIDRLARVLREDVRDEEDAVLPRLQEVLSPGQARRLGVAWEIVRRTAPTRPHPVVSRRPPGNVAAALPLSVLDNLRDLCDVSASRGRRGAASLVGASRALAAAAGWVERRGPMRRGETDRTSRAG